MHAPALKRSHGAPKVELRRPSGSFGHTISKSNLGRNDRTESITTAPLQQQRHRNSRLNFIVIRRVVRQPCARPSLTDTSFRLRTGLINRATGTASNPFEKIDLCLIKCAPRRCKSLHARAHLGGITRFGRLKKLSFELLDDQPLEV